MYTVNDVIVEILKSVEVDSYTSCTAWRTETVTHEIIISDEDDEDTIDNIVKSFEFKAKGNLKVLTFIADEHGDEDDDENFYGIVYEVKDRHGDELDILIELQ